ncbi:hypothetical protein BDZ91DRAFT_767728 [Kalaharituber pfeilii]|nr:hypothetical protein BDZ91DRAFT_767728 [Kalaharituber pfeilii]
MNPPLPGSMVLLPTSAPCLRVPLLIITLAQLCPRLLLIFTNVLHDVTELGSIHHGGAGSNGGGRGGEEGGGEVGRIGCMRELGGYGRAVQIEIIDHPENTGHIGHTERTEHSEPYRTYSVRRASTWDIGRRREIRMPKVMYENMGLQKDPRQPPVSGCSRLVFGRRARAVIAFCQWIPK